MKSLAFIIALTVATSLATLTSVARANASAAALAAPGLYRDSSGGDLYVGVEHYLPGALENETLDHRTRELGSSVNGATFVRGLSEDPRVLQTSNGPLGVSLYYRGSRARPTVILIHGNDPETRDMGFLIPYFVTNGMNVISYDQRGTGDSSGNWFLSGPQQRAVDVEAIYDAYVNDTRVDRSRFGLWGVSNGGWTAPIVADARPVSFMLLKSPPAETIRDNIRYEVVARLQHDGYNRAVVERAEHLLDALYATLDGTGSWQAAQALYGDASAQKWFADTALPAGLKFPLPAPVVAGFRSAVTYDPATTIASLHVPTIAFFCTLDRNVDVVHATKAFRNAAEENKWDYTERLFTDCGHSLLVSATGFGGEASKPVHFTEGYPDGMLDWLRSRGYLTQPR